MLDEMPLPADWDANLFKLPGRYASKDFAKALLYAKERSTYIAKGSSRAVFQIEYEGRPTILKMAMNDAGLSQNEREADVMFDGVMGKSPVIIPGIDKDEQNDKPLWIHQEFAAKAKQSDFIAEVGCTSQELIRYVEMMNDHGRVAGSSHTRFSWLNANPQFKKDADLVNDLYELWGNLGFEDDFVSDLRDPRNWGKFQGRLVIVDMGFSSNVKDQHYGRGGRHGLGVPKGVFTRKKKPSSDYSTP